MSFDKLFNLDQKYLYLVLAIMVSIPIIKPLGLPVVPGTYTLKTYDFISNLPDGSVFILDAAQTAGYGAELQTQYVTILNHLLSLDIKLIIVSFAAEGPMLVDMGFSGGTISGAPVDPEMYGDVYGEDYVYLGFIPGGETAFFAFAIDSWMTQVDEYGTPLEDLPIMEFCKTAEDWDAIMAFAGGAHEQRIAQWNAVYGTPLLFGVPGVSAPRMYSYIATGQVESMLVSLIGAAEYEMVTGKVGLASSLMDVLSLGQITIVCFILLGNVGYFIERRKGEN